jgi:hypothetical protein
MGRMARRSMSAASLASKSTDGRVMGRRAGSGTAPTADLMACSCAAIDDIASNFAVSRWSRRGRGGHSGRGGCAGGRRQGEAAAAVARRGRGGAAAVARRGRGGPAAASACRGRGGRRRRGEEE